LRFERGDDCLLFRRTARTRRRRWHERLRVRDCRQRKKREHNLRLTCSSPNQPHLNEKVPKSAQSADKSMSLQKQVNFFRQFSANPFRSCDLLDARAAEPIHGPEPPQQ